jgi:hypothetical protein
VHAWVSAGVPTQPDGVEDVTERVCVLFDWHALHAEYVYVQAAGAGGT